jgi:hypothetical protein
LDAQLHTGAPQSGQGKPCGQSSTGFAFGTQVVPPVSPLMVWLCGSTGRGGTSGLTLSFKKQFASFSTLGEW